MTMNGSLVKCFECGIYDHRKGCTCDCHKCKFFKKNQNHCGYCIEQGTAIECQTCFKKFRLGREYSRKNTGIKL